MALVLHPMATKQPELWSVKTIERATLVIATIFVVAGSFFWPTTPVVGGLLSGAIVGYLNFRFLKRMVVRFLDAEDVVHHGKSGLRFFIKMMFLIAVVAGLILYVEVNPMAFLVGFSSFVLAIGYEGLKSII